MWKFFKYLFFPLLSDNNSSLSLISRCISSSYKCIIHEIDEHLLTLQSFLLCRVSMSQRRHNLVPLETSRSQYYFTEGFKRGSWFGLYSDEKCQQVELHLVPGHSQIPGTKMADSEAKKKNTAVFPATVYPVDLSKSRAGLIMQQSHTGDGYRRPIKLNIALEISSTYHSLPSLFWT